jgi:hypothetical protein
MTNAERELLLELAQAVAFLADCPVIATDVPDALINGLSKLAANVRAEHMEDTP